MTLYPNHDEAPISATLDAVSDPRVSSRTVFLSYANADRERVEVIVAALEREGLDVWWDREIPRGQNFNHAIEAALNEAHCAVVVWSQASVASEWVFNEASEARKRRILVPVFIDAVEPPLEFRHLQAAQLTDWRGDASNAEWLGLLDAVKKLVDQPSASTRVVAGRDRGGSRQAWWRTPAGGAAGAGALLFGTAVLLMALNQIGVFRASPSVVAPMPEGTSGQGRSRSPVDGQTSDGAEVMARSTGGVAAPIARDATRANRLEPATGGKLVIANQESWQLILGATPTTTTISTGGFAVLAFPDDQPAMIDAIEVFVESTSPSNVKELALLASDQSETGPFRRVAVVSVPNYRNMRGPGHELAIPPFSARYVKIEVLGWHGSQSSSGYVGTLRLLGHAR